MNDALLETVTHARLRATQGDRAGAIKILKLVLKRKPFDPPAVHLLEQLMNPDGPIGDLPEEPLESRSSTAGVTGVRADQTEALRQKMSAIRKEPGEKDFLAKDPTATGSLRPERRLEGLEKAEAVEPRAYAAWECGQAGALDDSPEASESLGATVEPVEAVTPMVEAAVSEIEAPRASNSPKGSPAVRRLSAWLEILERASGAQWG